MDTHTDALAQRQFLWGLSNGIFILAIAGAFWSGLAASATAPWLAIPVVAVALVVGYAGVVVRREARGFRLRDLAAAPDLRVRARRIQAGFRWMALVETLLVWAGVGIAAAVHRFDLIWPAIGLAVNLHFIGIAALVRVRAYYAMAVAGSIVCIVAILLPASDLSPAARLQLTGLGVGLIVWLTAAYVAARATTLARLWDHAVAVDKSVVDSREATYWSLQIAGWGAYSAIGLWAASTQIGLQPALIVGYALYFGYSIALTDSLRRLARRRLWLQGPARAVWGRMLAGGLVVGLIQSVLIVAVNVALEGRATQFAEPGLVLRVALGTSLAGVMWSVYYMLLTTRRRRREEAAQLQLALREAELSALEGQLNPHFLFNALNSIRALVSENPPVAQDMITRLSNLLRHNLRHDLHHTVPLSAELEVVSDYLALETMRFDERLRVQMAIAPGARAVPVPTMIVQALVENAVKHGIAPLPAGGDLVIRGDVDGGRLVVNVENTGRVSGPSPDATQLGLANTRERLRLLYGDRARLDLSERDGRVAATLQIPVTA